MKQILPALFLFLFVFLSPKFAYGTISLSISGVEKKDDYYIVNITASGLSSTSGCFVQGMFTATPSSYFGYTWSSKGEWLKYDSSPDQEFVIANFVELKDDEPQNILVKPDSEASGYKGPGDYLLKIRRFISNGNSSSHYSNIIQLPLTEPIPTEVITETPTETITQTPTTLATNTPTPTPSPTKTPTTTPTKAPTSTPTKAPTKIPTKTPTLTNSPTRTLTSTTSAVLGESTASATLSALFHEIAPTPTPEMKIIKQNNNKTPFFVGILLAIGSGSLLYFRHRKD